MHVVFDVDLSRATGCPGDSRAQKPVRKWTPHVSPAVLTLHCDDQMRQWSRIGERTMDAGKPRGGGARHVVVGIPFSEAAQQRQNPAAGAERQLQAAEPVLHKVWPEPAQDPLVPAVVALGETTRPRRGPAVAWAAALGTVAAFTAM